MGPLWHYTCPHSAERIDAAGGLLEPANSMALLWLTDLRIPHREALGLTSYTLSCDRTSVRYRVTELAGVEHWPAWRRAHRADPWWRGIAEALEQEPGVMPMHWFVSELPVPATRC